MTVDEEEFISIRHSSAPNLKRYLPSILSVRKRHRGSRNRKHFKAQQNGIPKTFEFLIKAFDPLGEPVGPATLRELISIAIIGLFGEVGSKERFQWKLLGFAEKKRIARLRVVTPDIVSFRASLAILPLDQGRITILSEEKITEEEQNAV